MECVKIYFTCYKWQKQNSNCVNQKEYQLAYDPKKIKNGLASCMTTCRALNSVIWRASVFSVSWLYFLCVYFIPKQLFLRYCQQLFLFFQLNIPSGKNTSFLVVTAEILDLLAWLKSHANSWGNHYGKGGGGGVGILWLSRPELCAHPWRWRIWWLCVCVWWGGDFPKKKYITDTRMNKNGFWAGKSNRSPLMQLLKDPDDDSDTYTRWGRGGARTHTCLCIDWEMRERIHINCSHCLSRE